jgi:hypothetical protein
MQQNAKELSASRALLHPLKITAIKKNPASRQTARCWALLLRFGASFEDKTACMPFAFLCHIDTLPSVHRGNCTFSG